MAPKKQTRPDKKPLRALVLPSNTEDIANYVRKHEEIIYKKMTDLLVNAVQRKRDAVQIFSFENTGYCIFLRSAHYQKTLENIIDMASSKKLYKICDKANRALNILLSNSTIVELTRRKKSKKQHDRKKTA